MHAWNKESRTVDSHSVQTTKWLSSVRQCLLPPMYISDVCMTNCSLWNEGETKIERGQMVCINNLAMFILLCGNFGFYLIYCIHSDVRRKKNNYETIRVSCCISCSTMYAVDGKIVDWFAWNSSNNHIWNISENISYESISIKKILLIFRSPYFCRAVDPIWRFNTNIENHQMPLSIGYKLKYSI